MVHPDINFDMANPLNFREHPLIKFFFLGGEMKKIYIISLKLTENQLKPKVMKLEKCLTLRKKNNYMYNFYDSET